MVHKREPLFHIFSRSAYFSRAIYTTISKPNIARVSQPPNPREMKEKNIYNTRKKINIFIVLSPRIYKRTRYDTNARDASAFKGIY